jgi:GNAT superfamily N-acetyltransferase
LHFKELSSDNEQGIAEMSKMATAIVREHFDPLIGKAQNDYMLQLFQSEDAIAKQLDSGYRYFFAADGERTVGFIAFYPKGQVMYLSKFYLYRDERGKGYAHQMLDFIVQETKKIGRYGIELNVNKLNPVCQVYEHLGFKKIRDEKNDIGHGFYMDDFVYRLDLSRL